MTDAQATYRAQSASPTIKPFRCPTCKAVIGETNGTSLRIGDVAGFPFAITFSCLRCGGIIRWRPVGSNGNGYNGCLP